MTAPLDVTIDAGGIALAGHLRLLDATAPAPGVVFTGPFTGVKEQVVGRYADLLAQHGYATLAFDHRGFGASEGSPRQHEDSAGKLADLRAATTFLARHPAVDATRLACVGVCLGGGYALKHAAFDPRIRALATVAAAYNDPRAMCASMGADRYRDVLAELLEAEAEGLRTGEVAYLAAVSDDPAIEAAMPGPEPWEYYGTDRGRAPAWENRVTRGSLRELLTFDAAVGADLIGPTPTLIVHGRLDDYCRPEDAQAVFDRIDGPKKLQWLDATTHIDLYDQPAYVVPAVERIAAWFDQTLGRRSP